MVTKPNNIRKPVRKRCSEQRRCKIEHRAPPHFVDSSVHHTVEIFQVSNSPLLRFDGAVFLPSLGIATVLELASPSFTGESDFFPSALPILSNSCASVARGGPPSVSSSSPSSSHAGDGERLDGVPTCPCVLDLPLRGAPKRRRGVQSSDGEKSGCSGRSVERGFFGAPKCGFWKAKRLPRLGKAESQGQERHCERKTTYNT